MRVQNISVEVCGIEELRQLSNLLRRVEKQGLFLSLIVEYGCPSRRHLRGKRSM